ncbi:MAG: ribose 5-phosphate isomerase B [Clostridia bacterium]|nr:ribose 5-phosphate isomerase B [Clostridia bacterium]MDD4375295.1 ribose 5-phosphate isomerase B [Clostridia bacterium]
MIIIGTDHAGFELKEYIKKILEEERIEYIDVTPEYVKDDDYTDMTESVCLEVKDNNMGIAICGTGIGSSMFANKFRGIRAAVCYDKYTAEMTRKDNNANVLCLGGRTDIGKDINKIKEIVITFIKTNFSNENRHIRRLNKMTEIESRR